MTAENEIADSQEENQKGLEVRNPPPTHRVLILQTIEGGTQEIKIPLKERPANGWLEGDC